MTPRSVMVTVAPNEVEKARLIAEKREFDAVPIVGERDIESYWCRRQGKVKQITARQRVSFELSVRDALRDLVRTGVHFVEYRSHIVGLVDVSDLNKPRARLVFLQPLLELEQSVTLVARLRDIPDEVTERHLRERAEVARYRQRTARKRNLDAPLLEFAQFGDVLMASRRMGLLTSTDAEIGKLSGVRNSLFHGARRPVERFEDGAKLAWALEACERIRASVPSS
jgi:hypothetical protein